MLILILVIRWLFLFKTEEIPSPPQYLGVCSNERQFFLHTFRVFWKLEKYQVFQHFKTVLLIFSIISNCIDSFKYQLLHTQWYVCFLFCRKYNIFLSFFTNWQEIQHISLFLCKLTFFNRFYYFFDSLFHCVWQRFSVLSSKLIFSFTSNTSVSFVNTIIICESSTQNVRKIILR